MNLFFHRSNLLLDLFQYIFGKWLVEESRTLYNNCIEKVVFEIWFCHVKIAQDKTQLQKIPLWQRSFSQIRPQTLSNFVHQWKQNSSWIWKINFKQFQSSRHPCHYAQESHAIRYLRWPVLPHTVLNNVQPEPNPSKNPSGRCLQFQGRRTYGSMLPSQEVSSWAELTVLILQVLH